MKSSPHSSSLEASETSRRVLLSLDHYPCHLKLPVRWNDIGGDGVVCHVSLARYVEDARVALISQVMSHSPVKQHAMKVFVARFSLEQFREIHYPQELVLGAGVSRIGDSSYTIAIGIFFEGSCIGLSETVNVSVGEQNRPAPIPDDQRSFLLAEQLRDCSQGTSVSKPSAERYQAGHYTHSCEFETRFSDTDRLGHINNVAIVRYYEDAIATLILPGYREVDTLPVNWAGSALFSDVSFSGESHHSFPLRIASLVTDIRGHRLYLEQALFQRDKCVGVRDLILEIPDLGPALKQHLSQFSPSPSGRRL